MKKIFNRIRLQSGLARLKQEIGKMSRKNRSVSLSSAQNIGILVPIQNQNELQEAEVLATQLKKEHKRVKLMGFLFDKTIQVSPNSNIEIISVEDTEWNYIPKKEKILNFINNEFDILINLCTDVCFPLVYITALSKSLFKVGAYDKRNSAIFDFMVDTKQQSITGFSIELKHYLDKIK
jgi:hypothetical protein